MIQIIAAPKYSNPVMINAIHKVAEATLQHENTPPNTDVVICLEGDERMEELNRQFRDVDATTDVLAFPANEVDPESGSLYLGDIILSYPRAAAQALEAGHPVINELQLLTTHGVLHLLGYDHHTPEELESMWAVQEKILASVGCELSTKPGQYE